MAFTVQVQLDARTMALLNNMEAAFVGIETALQGQKTVFSAILAALTGIENSSVDIDAELVKIAEALVAPAPPVPVKISLALPIRTKKGVIMANFELLNDEVVTIPILTDDAAGQPVPAPSGDTFSAVSSNPASLNAVIGTTAAGNPALVINALVQESPGLSITVSDSAGLSAFTQGVDIVQDTTPKAITLDLVNVTEVAQPVPAAPGP